MTEAPQIRIQRLIDETILNLGPAQRNAASDPRAPELVKWLLSREQALRNALKTFSPNPPEKGKE